MNQFRKEIRKGGWILVLSLGMLSLGRGVLAQEFPTRSINLLICMQPGAGVDLGGRIIAQEAGKTLGQEIVPINRTGGGGAVAAGIVASSKSDGYTLFACTNGALTTTPQLESVPYDPLKDFVPVIQFGSLTSGLMVRADSPFKTFKELIEYARKNPGKLSYGFPGIGTAPHLAIEHVIQEEKVNIATVPFEGAAPALTALLGGHVSMCGVSTSGFLPHLKAGKVRVLAVTSEKRIDVVPEVPTLLELGYSYGVLMDFYFISAPKGIQPAVVKRLETSFVKAMETQGFQDLAERLYMQVKVPLTGQKLKELVQETHRKNGEIIRKAKIVK